MSVELTAKQLRAALPLFSKSPHHRIARACCLGLVEGRVFANEPSRPTAAVCVLPRMGVGFAAGETSHASDLLSALRGLMPWVEINDPPADWHPSLAAWSKESYATVRYGFPAPMRVFDTERLRALAVPPEGCTLLPYDAPLLSEALASDWSEDQIGTFSSPEDFGARGFGVALLHEGALAAGCASFCLHPDGVEIQIDTHPDLRSRGYATCACAAFMLQAMCRGQSVYWDAANKASLRLAENLGFAFSEAFVAWLLIAPGTSTETATGKAIGIF